MTNLALKEELATLDREDVSFGLGFCLFCPTTDNLSFRLSNVNPCVFFFFPSRMHLSHEASQVICV